jgi:DNA recombination protein RmuC
MLQIIFNILIFAAIVVAIILSVRRRSGSAKETRENMETLVRSMRESHEHEMELMRKNYEEQRRDLRDDFNRRIEALKAETASEYRDLSQQILRAESDRLSRQNVDQLGAMLTPFKERLESFRQLVVDSYDKENQARSSLSGQVEQLMKLNQVISREAHDLTTALKGDSKTQGDWGEMVLETLLEQAGLTRDVHFHVQATRDAYGNTLRNEEGNLLRPDVVLHLPDHKDLIVDSKVSLSAFADYCATNDPKEQEVLGRKHLESVKKHIKELADKKYQDNLKNAGDHVLMFMPTENAYLLAIRLDPTLWRYAYENRVAIVSPTHLFSVVQIISQLWKQDDQNRHVIRIAEEGGKLYDKLCTFCVSFEKISTALTQARRSYDDAYKTLATGHGNAISKAMKMREMGAKATKTFPTAIAEDASDDAVDLLH